jgi:uncharacterized protein DUF5681
MMETTMADKYEVGFGKPPKSSQWKKGQSGNPKGRPKTRTDLIIDAAAILSEPVNARTPDGKTVSLDGYEAAYLALCKKGLNGNVPTLIKAINIMLEVQPAVDARESEKRQRQDDLIARLEKMGVKTDGLQQHFSD